MSIERKSFGTLGTGEEVSLFILKSGSIEASFTDYGAILVSLLLPAGKGMKDDIVLGFATLAGYAGKHPFFGATVGRFANRIGKACFSLDGKEYKLDANNGQNHLHGGFKGFDKHIWKAEAFEENGEPTVLFSRASPDGEEGYPGNLEAIARYSLMSNGSLRIRLEATTDAPTIVNLTNHSYFNLRGEGRCNILNHELKLKASRYIPVGTDLIPTGEMASVMNSPFDFLEPMRIGSRIEAAGGYDHCYIIDRKSDTSEIAEFGEVREPVTGRKMNVATTLPGVQFYSGNSLSLIQGKRGSLYDKHAGFCLETEFFPDSPNRPSFPSSIVRPGQVWSHETRYGFSF